MYKPVEHIRCPKCGTTVNVNTSMILTSNPPCYEWTCPNCGKKGHTKHGDVITFETQTYPMTSGYIQKVDEPDPGVGVITTNADDITTINATPAIYSTNTKCTICGEEFKFDGEHRICPKCRKTIVKFREAVAGTADAMPADNKSTANTKPENKSTATDSKSAACNIPAPQFIQQGWQCPKCGAILAPHQHYCPFCSSSEHGRTNWLSTTPAVVEALTNPNSNTSISVNGVPKVPGSCTIAYSTPCDNIKVTQ